MSKVSTTISVLVQYIEEYRIIPIKYMDGHQVKECGKISCCRTPKNADGQDKPYVKIYDTKTDSFYDIAKEGDPYGTECIIELIKGKMEVPEDTESIFYSVFCLLHEAGHYFDYQKDPEKYDEDFIERDIGDRTREAALEYRSRPIEKRADLYAIEHLAETIKSVDTRLFRGMLLG